jgi:hypothetical protein
MGKCTFVRFIDVATFAHLTPFSLIFSSIFSFPVVSLEVSSLSTLARRSQNKIFRRYLRNL